MPQRSYRRVHQLANARAWLIGIMALATLGWLWLRETGSNTKSTRTVPSAHPPQHDTQIQKLRASNAANSEDTPLGRIVTRQPITAPASSTHVAKLDTTVDSTNKPALPTNAGAVLPLTNRFEKFSWQDILQNQLALAWRGFSPGSLDGKLGFQTKAAIQAFQQNAGLPITGTFDTSTRNQLELNIPLLGVYTITEADVLRLRSIPNTWLGKSQLDKMDYETVLELVAERAQSHPDAIRLLNPSVDWTQVREGSLLTIPNPDRPEPSSKAATLHIRLSARTLQAFDTAGKLLCHFPCSIGRIAEKRPVGELKVQVIAPDPNYTFNPDIFPESEEARTLNRKLILQPGPNNPVGLVWIGLDRPGYGIHGTPSPEQVGRTESHGCFRLANWNALYLMKMAWVGLPVVVDP